MDSIQCESGSPLGGKGGRLLDDPTVGAIAKKHERCPAQVIIRWIIQLGLSVNPKSEHEERIRQNLDVFDIHFPRPFLVARSPGNRNFRAQTV